MAYEDASGSSLTAYRFAHKTMQTFITSSYGPVNGRSQADQRSKIIQLYERRPSNRWDPFGLATFIRLCLRQDKDAPASRAIDLAVKRAKDPSFIHAVVNTPNLGADALRRFLQEILEH